MWDVCKTTPLIKEGASEEDPEVREMHADGKFCICWDPLDGSSIIDNNWACGTIIGIWPSSTGILGATGRDQAASVVALYGPRTTVFVTLDDGVYEFTYGANGAPAHRRELRRRHVLCIQPGHSFPRLLRDAAHRIPSRRYLCVSFPVVSHSSWCGVQASLDGSALVTVSRSRRNRRSLLQLICGRRRTSRATRSSSPTG